MDIKRTIGGSLATVVIGTLVALVPSASHATDTNQPDHWETQPGEVCVKVDDQGAQTGGYTVPAEEPGRDWSKLILKKGDGQNGTVENQVFEPAEAGETYTWQGAAPGEAGPATGGWSHVILCSVPEPDKEVTPAAPTFKDECGPDNEVVTITPTEGVTYDQERDGDVITVTATADDGYVLVGQSEWTFTVDDEPCPKTEVTATAPTFSDECGPDNEVVTITPTEGVTYDQERDGDVITVTATADDGYVLVGQSEWTFTVDDEPCPKTEVTATAPTFSDECGPDNEVVTITPTEGVTYDQERDGDVITVTATADDGYVLVGQSEWTFTVDDEPCPKTEVTATAPTFSDECGPGNEVVTITPTEGVTYSQQRVDNVITVTATANGGYVLVGQSQWAFTVDDQPCPAPTPPPVVPPTTVAPTVAPTTEVLGEQASGRAKGRLYTSCQRTVRVTMRNNTSRAVTYKVIVGKKVTKVRVKAESTKRFTTKGPNRSVAKLKLGKKLLAKKRIPGSCGVPDVLPATGKRHS